MTSSLLHRLAPDLEVETPFVRPRAKLPLPICKARIIALGYNQGRLGKTSKMPGLSYGLDAFSCIRGSMLAKKKGSVCSLCYARKNFYATWIPVVKSREFHQRAIGHPLWEDAMVSLLVWHGEEYFRWHDSGDIMGAWHLGRIFRVAKRTPWVKHWLPTHEPKMVRDTIRELEVPKNLCIRISADFIGRPPELVRGVEDIPTSTVHGDRGKPFLGLECKSYRRPNSSHGKSRHGIGSCGACRNCWNPAIANVSYPLH